MCSIIGIGLQTFWLLKVDMTLSALSLESKTISTTTVGAALISLQLWISPNGAIADTTSAAVVPGAKLLATTVKGPPVATPRMLNPGASSRAAGMLLRVLFWIADRNLSNVFVLRSTWEVDAVRLKFLPGADPGL
jgi:hypothetical protein